jgi:hypothetical protein
MLRVLDTVIDTVGVGVIGKVVGIPERVIETVPDLVRDKLPERVRETVPDIVPGKVVGIADGDPVMLRVLDTVIVTVGVGVKGKVVGIPDLVSVTD